MYIECFTTALKLSQAAYHLPNRMAGTLLDNYKNKGLWLVEVFNVVYKGKADLKPNKQIGTIKVNDGVNDQYLYKVEKIDKRNPSIQHLDEIVLTGPRIASISAQDSLTIDVDLFCGVYKDSFCIYPTSDSVNICSPLERKITSKDGKGEIYLFYAIFDKATVAHLKVKCLADGNFTAEVYGVIAASTSKIRTMESLSMLFIKKPSDKIKVGPCKIFPLSRSIVAVPLESELFLDIHLMTSDEHNIYEGTVKFQAEQTGTCKKIVLGERCKIQVTVTWKST